MDLRNNYTIFKPIFVEIISIQGTFYIIDYMLRQKSLKVKEADIITDFFLITTD